MEAQADELLVEPEESGQPWWRTIPGITTGATLAGLVGTAVTIAVLWSSTPARVVTRVGVGQNRLISKEQALVEALAFFVLPIALTVAAIVFDRRAARLHEDLRGSDRNAAVTCAFIAVALAVLLTISGIGYFSPSIGGR